jgi:glutaredoxin 3
MVSAVLNNLLKLSEVKVNTSKEFLYSTPVLKEVKSLMLELYHFESCPFCAKVRNKLEELDVSYISHPSRHGSKNREHLKSLVPEVQFPLIVDKEKNLVMVESDDICKYLEENYGTG